MRRRGAEQEAANQLNTRKNVPTIKMEVDSASQEQLPHAPVGGPAADELNRAASYMRHVQSGKIKVPSPALVDKYSDMLLKYPRRPRRCIDKAQRCEYCLRRMERQKASTHLHRVERGECQNPKSELIARYTELLLEHGAQLQCHTPTENQSDQELSSQTSETQ